MQNILPESLKRLAEHCPRPLCLVGGSVRDFLSGDLREHADWDLASACTDEEFSAAAVKAGFSVKAVYPRTGTVKAEDENGVACEFTRFRHDAYETGVHAPSPWNLRRISPSTQGVGISAAMPFITT